MTSAALVYSRPLAEFDYGDDHPFKPMRARNMLELCHRYGLVGVPGVLERTPATAHRSVAAEFHDPAYLAVLERANRGEAADQEMLHRGIGTADCPAREGIYDFSLLATGATLEAMQMVLDGTVARAMNPVGGFHHAFRGHAEGFCYVNDVGIALSRAAESGLRAAFVDIDAHHCNGVEDAFYEDDRVLVISLHETGEKLYPFGGGVDRIGAGAGLGFNVNVPLAPRSDDEVFVDAFRKVVPPLLRAFQPDFVLAELGADTLISDPLTHLRLTNNGYREVVRQICELCPERLVGVGGGGYDVFRTARAWTLAFAEMCGLDPADEYAGMMGGMGGFAGMMGGLTDPPLATTGQSKEWAVEQARAAVEHIWETVFPIHGAVVP